MLEAVIFDMDGLLIDSERLWREAEIEVFATVGVDLDERRCTETTGLRVDRVIDHWFARHPWPDVPPETVAARLVERVTELLTDRAELRPGACHAIDLVRTNGLAIALASSSTRSIIEAALGHTGLAATFPVVLSGDDVAEAKPHPAIYLATAERLGVEPGRCLALEDSVAGVAAARAAGMRCIAVPEVFGHHDRRLDKTATVLPSLTHLDAAHLGRGGGTR